MEGEIGSLAAQIQELISTNEELQRDKVKLEIRAVELEEKTDLFNQEKAELDEKIEELKTAIDVSGGFF